MAEPRRLARRGTRPILSPQRRRFALEWLRSSSATEAAIKAGYSPKTATKHASRLLTSVDVQRFLAGRIAKLELEADAVMGEVARQAFEEIPTMSLASPSIPSWNQILSFLRQMEQLRELAGCAA